MNERFLSLMSAVLIVMAAFASCDKDKNDSGGGSSSDNPFLVTVKNVIGNDNDIATVAGLVDYEFKEHWVEHYEVASTLYKNNGFEMKLPETVADEYLWDADEWFGEDVDKIISDNNARVTYLWIYAMDNDEDKLGEFWQRDESDNYYALSRYLYVDRSFILKGTTYEEDEGYLVEWNCTFKKGWNIMYYFVNDKSEASITTKNPSGVNLKWYFDGGNDWKTPLMSLKHKKDSFEQSFLKINN
jgi:hypothetical protein